MSQENIISDEQSADIRFEIIVNGRPRTWKLSNITFDQIVVLAFNHIEKNSVTVYTVTYHLTGEKQQSGTLVNGDIIPVKNRMVFNVSSTSRS